MDDSPHDPAYIPAPGSYHWTPRLQREFLEAFATNGSVKISAAKVCMSPAAVYQLKQRPEGAAFRLGCAAALLIARGRLVDELLDRAIWGHDEVTTVMREEDRSIYKRRRIDGRLGLAMLARLDRMVEAQAPQNGGRPGEDMLAQTIAGDWPGFLALFDIAEAARGGAAAAPGTAEEQPHGLAAALALWLAGRGDQANPLAALWRDGEIANEVAQISADSGDEDDGAETVEEAAAAMTVWFDDRAGEWRTDFPPPGDFYGHEEGQFGDPAYARALDDDELLLYDALRDAETAPLRFAGEAARRAFFRLPDPANDPAPGGGEARKSASG
ncbi:conserved protein of unknown function [uncultured Sphingopyxis sp.]|uniref:Uncharacterized protein n=1 Tax=uncultured Sphingopyxis sp. TaxID=310581 RepID=A0A1Y5PUB6_9SPHN|nr:hypothetical protein [uncultured Sphingopyxis sp.]SBV32225.1 conserved protein of unknown function [uncultured Sphingopyxis sp.]